MSMTLPETFVINLETSVARRERICQSMPSAIPWRIFPAISGANVGDSFLIGTHQFTRTESLTHNEFACKMSHLSLLNHVITSNLSSAIVMEDDVLIPPSFDVALYKLITKLPDDFDIVYLTGNTDMHFNVDWPGVGNLNLIFNQLPDLSDKVDNPTLFRLYRAWGAPAYLVSQSGARKILQYATESVACEFVYHNGITPVGVYSFLTEAIDLMMMSNFYRLNAFLSIPLLVHPNLDLSNTDIGKERGYS